MSDEEIDIAEERASSTPLDLFDNKIVQFKDKRAAARVMDAHDDWASAVNDHRRGLKTEGEVEYARDAFMRALAKL